MISTKNPQCNFRIACDVTNPLCGSQGATYIYGPQKGVTPDMLPVLDAGMKNYAEVTAKVIGKDNQNAAGAGAAGGLGFAFLNYLDGELTPGIQLILDAVHVEEEMKDADVVVTGEGCLMWMERTAASDLCAEILQIFRIWHKW